MTSVTREGLSEVDVGVAPAVRRKVRLASGAASPCEMPVFPRVRHHKAARCCHCDFCRPHGGTGGVRLCISPGHAGDPVIGDQMACGLYQQAVQ